MAQFGRALRSGRKGRRFKSCHPDFLFRGVAQLVARLLWEQDVGGSSPFTPISTHGGLAQLVRVLA